MPAVNKLFAARLVAIIKKIKNEKNHTDPFVIKSGLFRTRHTKNETTI